MTIHEIIMLPENKLKKHIKEVAKYYKEVMNKKICLSCGGDIKFMIYDIKKNLNMTKFQLKKPLAIYKVHKNKGLTISNANMTDELALEFLAVRKQRIELFSEYPENWEGLLGASECADCTDDKPCKDCEKRKELRKIKLADLQKQYPKVEYKPLQGMKKDDYINEIIKNY